MWRKHEVSPRLDSVTTQKNTLHGENLKSNALKGDTVELNGGML
jgi:hypothetical protein